MVIFIAEWGDLTQLATGTLASQHPTDRVTIFTAALLALWAVTLVAVVMGQSAKRYINPALIKRFGAFLFAVIGGYFILTAVRAFL